LSAANIWKRSTADDVSRTGTQALNTRLPNGLSNIQTCRFFSTLINYNIIIIIIVIFIPW